MYVYIYTTIYALHYYPFYLLKVPLKPLKLEGGRNEVRNYGK